jgi:hypothetical protein
VLLMMIKLLIATADADYAEHLSNTLSERHGDSFEVSVCTSADRLRDVLAANRFDAALLGPGFAGQIQAGAVRLAMLLVGDPGEDDIAAEGAAGFKKLAKYQRISSLAGKVMEYYAEVSVGMGGFGARRARVTAVWSPAGGTGKTTVALSFAASQVSAGRQAVYLNLENFSSTPVYFAEAGASISKLFEKMDTNVGMFQKGIRQLDSGSGIAYFCGAENYDDMNILSPADVEKLVNACAEDVDDLVIDLSSQCDERCQRLLCSVDTVLLVCDASAASQTKLAQFIRQHNVFGQIQKRAVLVKNKGARFDEPELGRSMQLPLVPAADPGAVFKTLSGSRFDF